MAATTYAVLGMTCEHCRAAVREEVAGIPGVTGVEVDLEAGALTVEGEGVVPAAVAAAVEEAGYQVVP
ncbi:MAG TPA: cation transporter [Miltoncostaea sp.]|nr:cation transporter [Miltoncostaea sp.]